MPYVIAAIVIVIAAAALFLLRTPVEAPATTEPQEITVQEVSESTSTTEPETEVETDVMDSGTETDVSMSETSNEPSIQVEQNDFDPADDERTFSATASYFTPKRTEHEMLVTLTLKDRVVVSADVTYDGGAAVTPSHSAFHATYEAEVIGKSLNEISLSRVGGASLTSDAFNEAVAEIRAERS